MSEEPVTGDAGQDPAQVLLAFTTLPDAATARRIAGALVDQGLVACASVQAPCHSVYRWQGQVEEAQEVPLVLKTTRAGYARLEAALRALHPYELPELVAVHACAGLPDYLRWVSGQCAGAPGALDATTP